MPHFSKTLSWYTAKFLNGALSLLGPADIELLGRMCGRSLNFDERRPIARFAHHLWDAVSTIPNYRELNGEKWLIERTGSFGFKIIFDVGANVGDWARMALLNHPDAKVHCFEIVGTTFAELQTKLAPFGERVLLNDVGLLDRNGTIDVHISSSNLISSIHQIEVSKNEKKGTVCSIVTTGDEYVTKTGIDEIDFLKIDVEGAEGRVLEGFSECLSAARIKMLQFEYNRGAVYGGFLLKDAYAFLRPRGYVVGKLTPNGVIFREFRVDQEDFSGPNYVACHESQSALIAALAVQ